MDRCARGCGIGRRTPYSVYTLHDIIEPQEIPGSGRALARVGSRPRGPRDRQALGVGFLLRGRRPQPRSAERNATPAGGRGARHPRYEDPAHLRGAAHQGNVARARHGRRRFRGLRTETDPEKAARFASLGRLARALCKSAQKREAAAKAKAKRPARKRRPRS